MMPVWRDASRREGLVVSNRVRLPSRPYNDQSDQCAGYQGEKAVGFRPKQNPESTQRDRQRRPIQRPQLGYE